jgi:hypothetical protein
MKDLAWYNESARPTVGAEKNTDWYCIKAVDRLHDGFTALSDYVGTGTAFTDTDFPTSTADEEDNMIWWEDFNEYYNKNTQGGYWPIADCLEQGDDTIEDGTCYYDRWLTVWPSINLFDADGSISWTEVNQGGAGTCYVKAAMAAVAPFPELIEDMFVDTSTNSEGIYNVKFYIRGKPWVVTVDDYMLF